MEHPTVIVTGQLIEEPNVKLAKWTKVIALIYFIHYLHVCVQYILGDASEYQWLTLLLSTFMFAVWLPLCGYHSSKKSRSGGNLALFTGVEWFLGCWNMFSLVSMWMLITAIVAACQTCEPTFRAGNHTCLVKTDSREKVEMSIEICSKRWPSIEHFATTILLCGMTTVSWVGAALALKTVKSKNMHIITVDSLRVPDISGSVVDTYEAPVVPESESIA